jgi:hypothetical protein
MIRVFLKRRDPVTLENKHGFPLKKLWDTNKMGELENKRIKASKDSSFLGSEIVGFQYLPDLPPVEPLEPRPKMTKKTREIIAEIRKKLAE